MDDPKPDAPEGAAPMMRWQDGVVPDDPTPEPAADDPKPAPEPAPEPPPAPKPRARKAKAAPIPTPIVELAADFLADIPADLSEGSYGPHARDRWHGVEIDAPDGEWECDGWRFAIQGRAFVQATRVA